MSTPSMHAPLTITLSTTLSCLLVLLAPLLPASEQAEPPAWLQPLFQAAAEPLRQRPEVAAEQLEGQRAQLAIAQEESAWNPRFHADASGALSEDRPNNSTELGGSNRVIRSDDVRLELGISQPLSSGTTINLQAISARETNNRANAVLRESWVSRIRLNLTQELLRGGSASINRAAVSQARSDLLAVEDALQAAIADAFRGLSEDWLEHARAQHRLAHAQEQLAHAQSGLELARARLEVGLSSRLEVLSRERDLVEQEASVARLQRAQDAAANRFQRHWQGDEIPPLESFSASPLPKTSNGIGFADTRSGRDSERAQERIQRSLEQALDRGRDSLTARAGVGLFAREDGFDSSWDRLSERETFELSAGLRYERILGSSRDRLEQERARLAQRQARLQAMRQERDWLLERDERERAWFDAESEVHERQRIRDAVSEERDLIQGEFAEGSAGIRDLLEADQRLRSAEQAVITARFNVLIAELRWRAHVDALPLPLVEGTHVQP
ncbi:MAG: hypothetical protein EA402_05455 [Planctomycetota bacterium]|nr:MAG: hypothetical protein EA402_05455 [Planctomycetota bacterium]